MAKKINLLLALFATIVSCGTIYSQTESITNENDSILLCNKCDSLYNRFCPQGSGSHGFVEALPRFPEGEREMMKFIANNLKYPEECKEDSIQGRVYVKFIIDESGKIICPRILKSLHPAADKEALRIVQLMPDWKPASNNGVPCKMCYTLPVLFTLNTTEANTNNKPNFFQRIFRKND